MNKLLIKFLIISLVIILSIMPLVSFAISSSTGKAQASSSSIITTEKEASPGEELPIKVDLSKIEYDSFILTISSSDVNFENSNVNTGIDISGSSNTTKIIVEKSKLNVNSLILTYKIPEDVQTDSSISINTEIAKYENGEKVTGTEIASNLSVKIVAKGSAASTGDKDDKEKPETTDFGTKPQSGKTTQSTSMPGKTSSFSKQSTSSMSSMSKSSMSMVEQNTYNGSSNNYLKKLNIKGYDLSPEFKKTSTTYFINVGDDVNSLKITANAESSKAKVNIYGNTNLKAGKNKILINVTAEDGEVRTYRIYVTKG